MSEWIDPNDSSSRVVASAIETNTAKPADDIDPSGRQMAPAITCIAAAGARRISIARFRPRPAGAEHGSRACLQRGVVVKGCFPIGRALGSLLIVMQCAVGVPVLAFTPAPGPQEPPVPEKPVAANRTVPTVQPPVTALSLPLFPTDAELTRARIFPEPLVPMPGGTSPEENAVLAQAIRLYVETQQSEKVAPLLDFLLRFPHSAWRPSLLANLGGVYRANGYLSRALQAWELAWDAAKAETEPRAKAVADFALGEFLDLSGKVGHADALAARLTEIAGRKVTGRAAQKLGMAREALWVFTFHHEEAAPSGPVALEAILAFTAYQTHSGHAPNPTLQNAHATPDGTSLSELKSIAQSVGLRYEMLVRPGDAEIPVPSVMHFKISHYSAIVKKDGDRYLLLDPILGGAKWVSRDAINEESSGYFLTSKNAAVVGWRAVSTSEAATVIGHCAPGAPDDDDPGDQPDTMDGPPPDSPPPDPSRGPPPPCECPPCGCATYALQHMSASLRVVDTPLTYTPAVGPAPSFRLTYNQREASQPQIYSYGNLGPTWTMDELSWVTDNPNSADVQADVYLRGGGAEHYTGGAGTGVYTPHWRSRAVLAKVSTSPVRYERRLPDGGVEVFAQPDGVISFGRHVYLTDIIDPQGLTLHLTYDASFRIVALTDATGLVTTLAYDLASDPLKLTKMTDPYGRFATLTYNAVGELASLTDAISLTSSFVYDANDFIASMTTPYGTTLFAREPDPLTTNSFRFIQATDQLGATERVEFRWSTTAIPATAPANQVPAGFDAYNQGLDHYNSLYWDKRAMTLYPGDVSKATITHWLLYLYEQFTPFYYEHGFSTSVPHSVKMPLENRVWYAYPGQGSQTSVGTWIRPTQAARVLDDGSSQIAQASYNDQGNVLTRTDPLGRQTSYGYAANGIDLVETRQTSSGVNDLLGVLGSYTALHQPQTVSDAAGQTTTLTYNAFGQVLTSTNAKSETTTLVYNASQRLQSVTGPMSGAVTTYTYDSYGRVRTVTQPDGYAVTTDYDGFDRPTRVTYPDGTTELLVYDRLDLSTTTDRLGRTTQYFHDPLRRLLATRDPAGRTITQQWCTCGSLDQIIDANRHTTTREHDVEARVTREVRADGTTATQYAYESTTSRLKTVTDPKGQVTTNTYNLDDSLQQVAYTNATIATPSVSYTYDPAYARLATMVDGTGATAYTYVSSGVLGATRVASVDGPLTNDTITYQYDELGRVVSRAINGVAATEAYDALGRMTTQTNVLGTFGYGYDGVTARLASVAYPNGQTSSYSYLGNVGDRLLQTIQHQKSDSSTLSKFDYTYDALGHILTWQQQADSVAPTVYKFGYDPSDELTAATNQTTGPTPMILNRYMYASDPARNRTSEQIDDAVTSTSYDALNRLTAQQGGGSLVFTGSVSEPASVTIQGQPVTVDANNGFSGSAPAPTGTTTVVITATDGSGNQSTATYQVDQTSASKAFAYDANGNLTSDGIRSFTWDAKNRLLSVTIGSKTSEFTYDGLDRRVRIVEKDGGATTSDKRLVWCALNLCEERADTGTTVTKRFFPQGVQDGGVTYFYSRDHLGSVREVTDASGALHARYAYDPWGRRTKVSGDKDADLGFTGHFEHTPSGLTLAPFRAYDANLGRWISEDPTGFAVDTNVYAYVAAEPIGRLDPLGDDWFSAIGNFAGGVATGAAATVAVSASIASGTIAGSLIAIAAVGIGTYGATIVAQRAIIGVDPYTGRVLTSEERTDALASLAGGILGGGLAGRGAEIEIGDNMRIAPFGNRTGHETGELPHYHRAVPDPASPGDSLPGQGIGRHRPWDAKSMDKNFCSRF
jgi:RHS repeat-associated protein